MADRSDPVSDNSAHDDPPADSVPATSSQKSLGDLETGADVHVPGEPNGVSRRVLSLGDLETDLNAESSLSDLDDLVGEFEDTAEIVDLETRYEIGESLGTGGMGEVWRAVDTRLKRPVAIKRLKDELEDSRRAMQRFLTEAQSIAQLNHFNIVQIYDYGRTADGPFIVMELVEGHTLAEQLKAGPLEPEPAVAIINQLCDALRLVHARGIVHRDIKPANILLTADGVPKLTDFGLARQETSDSGQTRTGTVMGTLDFMPPEQRRDVTQADARSDLWSLAATLYQMLTGDVPRVIRLNRVPTPLQDVLGKALEEKPSDRYQTATEFREALTGCLAASQHPLGAGTLAAGECASCGQQNDPSRKFCKACGNGLYEPCLGTLTSDGVSTTCEAQVPVWEQFCPECGTNLPELIDSRIAEYDTRKEEIESLRRQYRHGEAIERVSSLTEINHPRFETYREWAASEQNSLRQELQELEQNRDHLYQQAVRSFQAGGYDEALKLLEQIPEPLRHDDARRLQREAAVSKDQSSRLLKKIRSAVSDKQYDGLSDQTARYLELKPRSEGVRKLHERLQRWNRRKRLKQLAAQIRSAMENDSYNGLLPVVQEYLTLQPNDETVQQLAEKLQARERHRTYFRKYGVVGVQISNLLLWLREIDRRLLLTSIAVPVAVLLIVLIFRWRSHDTPQNESIVATNPPVVTPNRGPARKPAAGHLTARNILTLKGHTGYVHCVAFSPDGKRIVSGGGSNDNMVKVWDATSGREILTLKGHALEVMSVAFSPDGRRIVSGSVDKTVKIWNSTTGHELLTLKGHTKWIGGVAFSPDGKRIASGSADKTLKVWDAITGRELMTLRGHTDSVNSVAFSPGGKQIVSGSADKTLKVWDATSGREILTLKGHTLGVMIVAFSPDGKRIASGSNDSFAKGSNGNSVKVWDAASGRELLTFTGHTGRINGMAFSPDGKWIVSGSRDETLKIWDVTTGRELLTLKGHTGHIYGGIAFSPDGKHFAAASAGRTIRIWALETVLDSVPAKQAATGNLAPQGKSPPSGDGHFDLRVKVSIDGLDELRVYRDRAVWLHRAFNQPRTVALNNVQWNLQKSLSLPNSGSTRFMPDAVSLSDCTLTIVKGRGNITFRKLPDHVYIVFDDADAGESAYEIVIRFQTPSAPIGNSPSPTPPPGKVKTLSGHSQPLDSVAFSPNGRMVASAGVDKTIRIWDVATGRELCMLKCSLRVLSVAFSPDSQTVVSGGDDRMIRIWDVATGRELHALRGHTAIVRSVIFSPDGRTVVSGSDDGTIRLWNTQTGRELQTLKGHTGPVSSVAASQDGRRLASASSDKTVRIWDIQTGQELRTLKGHTKRILCIAFSPGGRTVASGSSDKTVRIWDVQTGRELRTLRGHTAPVMSVTFSPDGQHILTGSYDKTLRLWNVRTGAEVDSFTTQRHVTTFAAISPDGRFAVSAGGDYYDDRKKSWVSEGDFALQIWRLPKEVWPKQIVTKEPTALSPTEILTSDEWEWTKPVKMGATINSNSWELHPDISSDGLTLLFSSGRPGGHGGSDLWMSKRTRIDSSWSQPVNLGPNVNSSALDGGPCLSADGLTLFFHSTRSGGSGKSDLWMSRRTGINVPWSKPVNLGSTVNSSSVESAPTISGDGLTLLFNSDRLGGVGDIDLWMATRPNLMAPWSKPLNLGKPINTKVWDSGGTFTPDGQTLIFVSARSGGVDLQDLWLTTRGNVDAPWNKPVNLGPIVNSRYHDGAPSLSSDGRTLIFSSDRPIGQHAYDLWITHRVRKQPPVTPQEPSATGTPAALSPTEILNTKERKWSKPVNLGPVVNSRYQETNPALSSDGLLLLFASKRPGGRGSWDLWMSSRKNTDAKWGKPINLDGAINNSDGEYSCAISADKLTLIFASRRPGGLGSSDLWLSTRTEASKQWKTPRNLGRNVNKDMNDDTPAISSDGTTLLFTSVRLNGSGSWDLWTSTRRNQNESWGKSVNLGPNINSKARELSPALSSDGRTLIFSSDRPASQNVMNFWMTTRPSVDQPWRRSVKLGSDLNSSASDRGATLSGDGRTLIYYSDRPGGQGGDDLWITHRVRKQPRTTGRDGPSRWLNETYNFTVRRVRDKVWEEAENKTGRVTWRYTETQRTKDYTELFDPKRKYEVRLRADRMELKKGGKWIWVAKGHWEAVRSKPSKANGNGGSKKN